MDFFDDLDSMTREAMCPSRKRKGDALSAKPPKPPKLRPCSYNDGDSDNSLPNNPVQVYDDDSNLSEVD